MIWLPYNSITFFLSSFFFFKKEPNCFSYQQWLLLVGLDPVVALAFNFTLIFRTCQLKGKTVKLCHSLKKKQYELLLETMISQRSVLS